MTDSDPSSQRQEMAARAEDERLKYLEFVQTAAIRATECFFIVYGIVEGTVKSVVGPLYYNKFLGVPIEVLKFVISKCQEILARAGDERPQHLEIVQTPVIRTPAGDERPQHLEIVQTPVIRTVVFPTVAFFNVCGNAVCGYAKFVGRLYNGFHCISIERQAIEAAFQATEVLQASSQTMSAAQQAPEVARNEVSEVRHSGLKDFVCGIMKSVYAKYERKAEQGAASAWHKLNQLPLFPRVVQATLPPAAYCTKKYNETVRTSAEKGYKFALYLPLVPTEKIAEVFNSN